MSQIFDSRRDHCPMVVFEIETGQFARPYHSITEIATIAAGLVVHFSDGGQVQILGSLLGPLFEALAENKCFAVRIGGEKGKMQISAIAVLAGDD